MSEEYRRAERHPAFLGQTDSSDQEIQHVLESPHQKAVFVLVMGVEGGASHVRLFDNVLNGNQIVGFRLDQLEKRMDQGIVCTSGSSIFLFFCHVNPRLSGHLARCVYYRTHLADCRLIAGFMLLYNETVWGPRFPRGYSQSQRRNQMNETLNRTKRIGTGLSFLIFPLVFVFAFAGHPNMMSFHFLSPEELILRAHGNGLLHFGHALVTLNTGLLVVVALYFMNLLNNGSCAWAGFVGGVVAVFGSLMLAADKGALCLTMSALDSLSGSDFAQMMPGLLAMFSKQGWLVLIWGLLCLPSGFVIQAIALLKSRAIPRWQGILFLVGVLFIGTPDGVEIVNLSAAILIAIAFVPYGIRIIANRSRPDSSKGFTGWARGSKSTSIT